MGYNPNIPHLQVGYKVITVNPFTNHLLTSWDIQEGAGTYIYIYFFFLTAEGRRVHTYHLSSAHLSGEGGSGFPSFVKKRGGCFLLPTKLVGFKGVWR